mmetsp:Transcript_50323/g.129609  ORF Transcript_50323/g.129609 Transcript_50323/m.129609 type:complete len:98 (+) Transcript_50323:408-701(+)
MSPVHHNIVLALPTLPTPHSPTCKNKSKEKKNINTTSNAAPASFPLSHTKRMQQRKEERRPGDENGREVKKKKAGKGVSASVTQLGRRQGDCISLAS